MTNKHCASCGAVNTLQSAFCKLCGKPFEAPPAPQAASPTNLGSVLVEAAVKPPSRQKGETDTQASRGQANRLAGAMQARPGGSPNSPPPGPANVVIDALVVEAAPAPMAAVSSVPNPSFIAPLIAGVCIVLYSAFASLVFLACEIKDVSVRGLFAPGFPVLLLGFSVLMLPGGVGVILRHRWGLQITHGMIFGTIVVAALLTANEIPGPQLTPLADHYIPWFARAAAIASLLIYAATSLPVIKKACK